MVPEDSEENYAVITDDANPVNSSSNQRKKHKKFTNGYHRIEDLDLDPSLYVPF